MKAEDHPIAKAVEAFVHAIRDTESAARIFIPLAVDVLRKNGEETASKLETLIKQAENQEGIPSGSTYLELDKTARRLHRLSKSRISQCLERSLFVGIFSIYDAFFGELLRCLLDRQPALLRRLGSSITTEEVLMASSIEDLKSRVMDQAIDDLRRKSYADQFSSLENSFGLQLRKFDAWKDFIEASQRRHLFTHCDGKVSLQYLAACREIGCELDAALKPGVPLKIGRRYYLQTCNVVLEVGIKLAHTLWRKVFPNELELADTALSDLAFEYLKDEKWAIAEVLTAFGRNQVKISAKPREKVLTVNYCIALKFGGKNDECTRLLTALDWSDAAADFRLARSVLLESYQEARQLMLLVGKAGDYVSEHAYHTWPLFRAFRGHEVFMSTYREVYDHDFIVELRKEAEKSKREAEATLATPPATESAPDGTSFEKLPRADGCCGSEEGRKGTGVA